MPECGMRNYDDSTLTRQRYMSGDGAGEEKREDAAGRHSGRTPQKMNKKIQKSCFEGEETTTFFTSSLRCPEMASCAGVTDR
ncbi:hypothetical protein NPIL_510521 [Nephila pilipes]|uniref:Uncharacterized protein n=1 Tax=Nephila pilipes TaxID=299642 RepID=A0A8X6QGR3_NEPPI|nr:hypothetical protein NPIL_510521 [Nephila pilipes]